MAPSSGDNENSELLERMATLESRVADLELQNSRLQRNSTELGAVERPPKPRAPSHHPRGVIPPVLPTTETLPPIPIAGPASAAVPVSDAAPVQAPGPMWGMPPPPRVGQPTVEEMVGASGIGRDDKKVELTTESAIKWAGLCLLFLAAAFMVSTAINRGWIGPRIQLASAAAGGVALIRVGLNLRDRDGWGSSLVQVGVGVLFVCTGAAWDWLEVGSAGLSATGAVLVGIAAIVLAREISAWVVGLWALVGLAVVPLWMGQFDAVGLGFVGCYVLAVLGTFTYLYLEQEWAALWVCAAVVSGLFTLGVSLEEDLADGSAAEGTSVIGLVLAAACIYWLTPIYTSHALRAEAISSGLAGSGIEGAQLTGTEPVGLAPAKPGLGGWVYRITLLVPAWLWICLKSFLSLNKTDSVVLGLIIVVIGVSSAFGFERFVVRTLSITQLMAASIVLTIVLAQQFGGPVLLAALAVQAAGLVALISHADDPWFTIQAVVSAGFVLLTTLAAMLVAVSTDVDWTNDATHLLVVSLSAGLLYLEAQRERSSFVDILGVMVLGGLLLWVLTVLGHFPQGQAQVSVAWSLIAVALIGVAVAIRSMPLLRTGLATLGLVVAKLLTVDLEAVDTFWRVGLFFVIGTGLLLLSYQLPRLMGASGASPKD